MTTPKWTTYRRETGLIEHTCEHGVGHPNHGSALWLAEAEADLGETEEQISETAHAWLTHGCDGCCGHEDFPGTYYHALRYMHALLRKYSK